MGLIDDLVQGLANSFALAEHPRQLRGAAVGLSSGKTACGVTYSSPILLDRVLPSYSPRRPSWSLATAPWRAAHDSMRKRAVAAVSHPGAITSAAR